MEYHYVLMDYLCRAEMTPPRAVSDAAEARWVALKDLETVGLPRDTARVIRRAAAKCSSVS